MKMLQSPRCPERQSVKIQRGNCKNRQKNRRSVCRRKSRDCNLAAFVLNMPERPDVERLTAYYAGSMMTPAMKWFCRKSGKSKFTEKDISSMKAAGRLRAADRNPYSWNMDFYPYPDGSGYEARFTACGICTLMRELELYDLVPAMCRLDYIMAEAGGTSDFVREYTLASGAPYCDCGYKKKRKGNGRKRK